jgi:hypothetical protein
MLSQAGDYLPGLPKFFLRICHFTKCREELEDG